MATGVELCRIETDIPAGMDRLPWARWHWLVVIGLGNSVDPRRPRGDDRRFDVGRAQVHLRHRTLAGNRLAPVDAALLGLVFPFGQRTRIT